MTSLEILEKALVGKRLRFVPEYGGDAVEGVCVGIQKDNAIEEGVWFVYRIALTDGNENLFSDHDADIDFKLLDNPNTP